MKNIQNILLLIFVLTLFGSTVSCDKVDDPYLGIETGSGGDTSVILNADSIWGDTGNTTIRKMMVEEITGQLCGNCPPKTKLIVDWVDSEFMDKVLSVAFHATAFATPNPKYPDDHRTIKGTKFNDDFGNVDAPVAVFNRLNLNGAGFIVQGSKFETEFRKLISNVALGNPKVQLKILNIYDKDSLKNRLVITLKALKNLTSTHTAIIYVTEDPVLGDQVYYNNPNGDKDIFDTYEHRHMFRDAIGPLDGNSIISSSLSKGESISKTFNYKLNTAWNAINCRYTIAIRNNATGEIIQVDEVHAVK